ncbi:MAG TPA: organomercurial lyase [Thermoanaerobaculia bacterium]|nr:organomercurial lyase [Thermoanaerobaculia bacterium]
MDQDFETAVKLEIYRTIAETAKAPSAAEVAQALGASVADILAAFGALHARRLIVPEPADPARIRMAPPFSGAPTAFLVKARGKEYFANCVWDALGVAAALHEDAVVAAEDGFTGEPMTLEVRGGRPGPAECVAHFAVPAARWWEDIVYT